MGRNISHWENIVVKALTVQVVSHSYLKEQSESGMRGQHERSYPHDLPLP
jgi:hypothetical protein